MNIMLEALYEALYVTHCRFQWVTFTKYETVRGSMSRDLFKSEL